MLIFFCPPSVILLLSEATVTFSFSHYRSINSEEVKNPTIKEEKDEGKEKEVDGSCELLFEPSIVSQIRSGCWSCFAVQTH